MKTTLVIADELFKEVQEVARKEKTSFQALTERGLRLLLREKRVRKKSKLPPLVTVRGQGLTKTFRHGTWEQIRDESYRGRGAVISYRRSRRRSLQA